MIKFTREINETEVDFVTRLNAAYEARMNEMDEDYHPEVSTLEDCRIIHNREFGYQWVSDVHIRTKMGRFRAHNRIVDMDDEKFKMNVAEQDVMREKRNELRKEARGETLVAKIGDIITSLEPIRFEFKPIDYFTTGGSTIAVLSDWHVGAKHSNYVSSFDLQTLKIRIAQYAHFLVQDQLKNPREEIIVLNTGDLVEGMIHISTRIQAEFDIIEQTMIAGELVVAFLKYLVDNTTVPIKYGAILDNHSRVHPNKKEAIEKESFAHLIQWHVKHQLSNSRVEFIENKIDDNIGYIEVQGKKFAYVHGHLDKPATVKDRLSRLIGTLVDYVIISHRHHEATLDGVFQSGTMKGVDEYAINFRASDAPSQMIIYVDNHPIPHVTRRDLHFDVDRGNRYINMRNA